MNPPKIRNMEEFAAISGISRPTLSKYFNNPDSVRKTTRQRIEAALEQHDYRPNVYAMNQNRQTTRNVGVIVPNLADPFFNEIGRAVEVACLEAGYSPILLSSHGKPELEAENLVSLRSLKPAGVLLAPFGRASDRKTIEKVSKEVPTVLFDANISETGAAFVGTDNFQSVGLIVEYLCRSGEPPCLFEMEIPSNPNALTRRQAYLQSMEHHGFAAHILQAKGMGWDFEEIGQSEGGALIRDGAFPTNTILCSNDRLAIGMLSAAYKLGRKVGHGATCDIRIAGHDDHPFSRFTCPSLTTIAQDYAAIAERAATALFRIIDTGKSPSEREETLFEGKLVLRDSA
ncbi:LacI family DNA-binding transcriptional regulator [Thalassorhabdomicrobium marinisediminis]|uniref:LacI family transcriptional regulator n=1 Tax=Thalassorhabdomicrobium marinisediminis TaxID=2170577 RepID=A0A2T7FWG4_9RHOB|nr:LacI family DNA-binding transcriptional regulator [Thalassorhabdomicrobium marinisediminis]PVA06510.1 LacI family transcriptional regulator [Thalassorhabdomicrobium marinisediminis]